MKPVRGNGVIFSLVLDTSAICTNQVLGITIYLYDWLLEEKSMLNFEFIEVLQILNKK